MASIGKFTAINGTTYDIKDAVARSGLANKADATEAIKNITKNGTTFTVTRCDNTTFTFDQQDVPEYVYFGYVSYNVCTVGNPPDTVQYVWYEGIVPLWEAISENPQDYTENSIFILRKTEPSAPRASQIEPFYENGKMYLGFDWSNYMIGVSYDDDSNWSVGDYVAFKYSNGSFIRVAGFDASFIKAIVAEADLKMRGMITYVDGETADGPVSENEYLYIKNHPTLKEGYYISYIDMPAGHAITESDVGYRYGGNGGITNELAKKFETVADITRDGTTFIVTRADGTSFTFDQQEVPEYVYLGEVHTVSLSSDSSVKWMDGYIHSWKEDQAVPETYFDGSIFLLKNDGVIESSSTSKTNGYLYLGDSYGDYMSGRSCDEFVGYKEWAAFKYTNNSFKKIEGFNFEFIRDLMAAGTIQVKKDIETILDKIGSTAFTVTSVANFNSQLDSMLSNMAEGEMRSIRYAPGGRYAPFQAFNYVGTLHKVNATNACVDLRRNGDIVSGWKAAGVWGWASLTEHVLVTPLVTFASGESISGTNTRIYASASSVHVQYQGASKTHAAGTLLFTLPEGLRPHGLLYVPFVKDASAYGILSVNTNGEVKVSNITSSTASGRIYSTFDFPLSGWVQNP